MTALLQAQIEESERLCEAGFRKRQRGQHFHHRIRHRGRRRDDLGDDFVGAVPELEQAESEISAAGILDPLQPGAVDHIVHDTAPYSLSFGAGLHRPYRRRPDGACHNHSLRASSRILLTHVLPILLTPVSFAFVASPSGPRPTRSGTASRFGGGGARAVQIADAALAEKTEG